LTGEPASGRLKAATKTTLHRAAPPGSKARAVLRVTRQVMRDGARYADRLSHLWGQAQGVSAVDPDYGQWLEEHRVTAEAVIRQADLSATHRMGLQVDILVVGDSRTPARTDRTLDTLAVQTAPNWRATVVGHDVTSDDRRVRSAPDTPNWAAALADLASAGDDHDLVLVVEAGDLLEPDFVFNLAARAWANPFLTLLHWDDDVLDGHGKLFDPRFRPEWSPEMLLSANYLGRSFAVRRDRLAELGAVDLDLGDGVWWDLLLRLDPDDDQVDRVPRVVHHLARRPESAPARGVDVVRAHLDRVGRVAQVSASPAGVRVAWELQDAPHVTVIIPTRHNRPMLSTCLRGLAKTDYPSFDVLIVDNGEQTPENEAWYLTAASGLDIEVRWWKEPFNYSAVNNQAAAHARGEVLVFLNDDAEPRDPVWMRELVSWVRQPDVGLVGVQLLGPDGEIQHGGVVLGMSGFADHLFAGLTPGDDTMFGSTLWYRNSLSVTAACVAVEHSRFDAVGGFDERFKLCGSDVVLGLDMRFLGLRNVVTPFAEIRHLESATRGTYVVPDDFPASYWRYQRWLRGGDPYYSPNLSLLSTRPLLRDSDEPSPMVEVGKVLDRDFTVFRQKADAGESLYLADTCRADEHLRDRIVAQHEAESEPFDVHTVNWFLPEIDSPFYGGFNTVFRIADQLATDHGVENRFVVMARPNEPFLRSALAAAFPRLAGSPIEFFSGNHQSELEAITPADVSIATLWVTAYSVAHVSATRRRFYLVQDFEPMFYPAGTNYALAEETYSLGLYGLCNTDRLLDIYRSRYGGDGMSFMPAVDRSVFHSHGRQPFDHDGPATVFVYARPGHWRNCWEIASLALQDVKRRLGPDVRIVTAGSWATPDDLGHGIEHLGLLDYRDTGELYRNCDVGIALTLSAHPSYLPLELMACGTPVVAFDNPAGDWILHHEENSLRCPRTVDGLADAVTRLASDATLRARLSERAIADIAARHDNWGEALSDIYGFLCDPVGSAAVS
jgi:O-antigen biosynthesis protein